MIRRSEPIGSGSRAGSTALWVVGVATLLTVLCYGVILTYPFLFDDLIHLRWLEGRGVFAAWTNIKGMQHYRPLVFSVWAASRDLFGPHNAIPLHGLSLLLHILNACLVGWLAVKVILAEDASSREMRAFAGCAAAALFVIFPFSYQVLPSPGSQSKPLSAALILSACWFYWQGRSRRRWPWLALALASAMLAPFAYESAITVGGYLLIMEWTLWRRGRVSRPSPRALALLLLGLPFLVVWRSVPSSYDPVTFPGWEALWQSSIYFAQGLAWPLALWAKPLMRWAGLSDGTATAMVAYGAMGLLALSAWQRRRPLVLVVAFGWYALSLLVQWLTLSFRYVIDGPRILYLASVGAALLWADLLVASVKAPHRVRRLGTLIGAIALIAIVGWGMSFSVRRMKLIEGGLSVLRQASSEARLAKEEDRLLFVNMPSWLAPDEEEFPLGHEGYTLLPPYYAVSLSDFVYANTGVKRHIRER